MRSSSAPLFALLALLPRLSEAMFFTSPSPSTTWASAAGQSVTWSHQRGDPTVGTILLQAIGTRSTVVVATGVDLLAETFTFPSGVALRSNSQTYELLIVNSADISYVYTQVGPFGISSFSAVTTKSKDDGVVVSSDPSSSSSTTTPAPTTSSSAPAATSSSSDETVTSTADPLTVTSDPGAGTSDVVITQTRTASTFPTIGSSGTSGSWKLESRWTGAVVLAAVVGSVLV